jgi:hypothetical protein
MTPTCQRGIVKSEKFSQRFTIDQTIIFLHMIAAMILYEIWLWFYKQLRRGAGPHYNQAGKVRTYS